MHAFCWRCVSECILTPQLETCFATLSWEGDWIPSVNCSSLNLLPVSFTFTYFVSWGNNTSQQREKNTIDESNCRLQKGKASPQLSLTASFPASPRASEISVSVTDCPKLSPPSHCSEANCSHSSIPARGWLPQQAFVSSVLLFSSDEGQVY